MPRIHTEDVELLAFCTNALCPGYKQEPVAGIRETVVHTFGDTANAQGMTAGGTAIDAQIANLTENTNTYLRAQEGVNLDCPHCGQPRQVSEQVRPEYRRVSQVPQDQLLRIQHPEHFAKVEDAVELAALKQQNADLAARLEALEAEPAKPNGSKKAA